MEIERRESYCFGCSKKRKVKKVGEYEYEGAVYPIVLCQWCRAVDTRAHNQKTHPLLLSGGSFGYALVSG